MRGNGAVCVDPQLKKACDGLYLEESAITELAVMATKSDAQSVCFTESEVKIRATGSGRNL